MTRRASLRAILVHDDGTPCSLVCNCARFAEWRAAIEAEAERIKEDREP